MKYYKLMLNKWIEIPVPTYEDTLMHWVFLYDGNGKVNGIGIY